MWKECRKQFSCYRQAPQDSLVFKRKCLREALYKYKEGEDKKVGLVVFKMHKMDREQILPKSIEATW